MKKLNDTLSDRMKTFYEQVSDTKLIQKFQSSVVKVENILIG